MSHTPSNVPASRPVSDEDLLHMHQAPTAEVDDKGNYTLLPLGLLFFFSGLILFSGSYIGFFAGKFSPLVQDERAMPVSGAIASGPVDPAVLGKIYFATTCALCHQATGLGQTGITPPLAGSEWVTGSEERLIRIVLSGLTGPVTVKGTAYPGTTPMPAFGGGGPQTLSDDRIAAILTYIRQEWGNAAGPISPDQVKAIHAQVGTRAPWTAPELLALP